MDMPPNSGENMPCYAIAIIGLKKGVSARNSHAVIRVAGTGSFSVLDELEFIDDRPRGEVLPYAKHGLPWKHSMGCEVNPI